MNAILAGVHDAEKHRFRRGQKVKLNFEYDMMAAAVERKKLTYTALNQAWNRYNAYGAQQMAMGKPFMLLGKIQGGDKKYKMVQAAASVLNYTVTDMSRGWCHIQSSVNVANESSSVNNVANESSSVNVGLVPNTTTSSGGLENKAALLLQDQEVLFISEDKHDKIQQRYFVQRDTSTLQRLRNRFKPQHYRGDGSVADIRDYFEQTGGREMTRSEKKTLQQCLKYYDAIQQHCVDTGVPINARVLLKSNMTKALLILATEFISEVQDMDDAKTVSSLGITEPFKRQKLDDMYKVVGECGAVIAKNLDLQAAVKIIQDMQKCLYCKGTLTMEQV